MIRQQQMTFFKMIKNKSQIIMHLIILYQLIIIMKIHCLYIVTIILFINIIKAAYQVANWPQLTNMKSGDHKLLFTPKTGIVTINYTQPYGTGPSYATAPYATLSMRDLQIDKTSIPINFYISINSSSIGTTSFSSIVQIRDNFTIVLLYYMYITMDKSFPNTYFYFYSTTTVADFNSTVNTKIYTKTINVSIANYATARVIPFITSFNIQATNQYGLSASANMPSPTTIDITISCNSTLNRIQTMVILIDKTKFEAAKTSVLDQDVFYATNSGATQVYKFRAAAFNYYNYITGIINIRVNSTSALNFYVTPYNTIETQTSFQFIQYMLVHWRKSSCTINITMPYFALQESRCYDICSNSLKYNYGTNTNGSYCQICSNSCASCQGDGISCITCPSGRNFTNKQCLCGSGYYDNGINASCLACVYTCQTCSNNSYTCNSCTTTRVINGTSCNCQLGKYDNGTNSSTCLLCHYSCTTCSGSAVYCTSCDTNNHRVLDTQTSRCICLSNYQDNGVLVCVANNLTCSQPCVSCQVRSTNCTSCNYANKRTFSAYSCVCLSGYTDYNISTCVQICGDGLIKEINTTQCDDGNTINGDGCSSLCKIQTNFNCINYNTSPSICTSKIGYTINLVSLTKATTSNDLTAEISVTPIPPKTSSPYLQSLTDYLNLQSYSSNKQTFILKLLLKKQIPKDNSLLIGLTNLTVVSSIHLVADNNLQLNYYDNSYFFIYNLQSYLVWAYIALLWIGSILLLYADLKLFGGVIEVFTYSVLAWIAIQGQQTYSLLYLPLKNLRYIFGYNLQLNYQSNLFEIYNIGLIYNILPAIIFMLVALLNKIGLLSISLKIKRFIFFDLTYGWLAVNGFLVAYGLGITTYMKQSNNTMIISYCMFGLYLIIFTFMSYQLFFKERFNETNQRLQYTKYNFYKPKAFPLYIMSTIIVNFVYVAITNKTRYNSFIVICYIIITIFIIGIGNILINKMRYLINLISLLLIYCTILLYNFMSNATWSGLTALLFMYIQLIINFSFLYCQKNVEKIVLPNQNLSQGQKNEMKDNLNKSINEDQHYNQQFIVYDPTIKTKKKDKNGGLQIQIDIQNQFKNQTTIKRYQTKGNQRFTSYKKKREEFSQPLKQNNNQLYGQQLLSISKKRVPMDSI